MSATVPPATESTTEPGVKTFRGESLEELLPQIREELGADAVILRQRDGLKGGVGGFFQKRCVEVDARAGAPRVDTYAGAAEDEDIRSALDGDAPDFAEELENELEAAEDEDEDRFTRPGVAAPAAPAHPAGAPMLAPVFQPGVALPAGALTVKPADPAIAEGLEAPAIRALFEAAAPFAEQLHMADAALPKTAAPAPVAAAPAVAAQPVAAAPVAPAQPVAAAAAAVAVVEPVTAAPPVPAAPVTAPAFGGFQPGVALPAAAVPIQPADPAVAEGLEAPAIRAIFEAAAPFAEQLHMADAALPRVAAAEPVPAAAPVAAPVEAPAAPLPVPVAEVDAGPAPGRPVQADTQEAALVEGGLSPALAADVVAETVSHMLPFGTPRQLKRLVRQALARRIPVQGPRALGGAALVLAGAGGTGKTLTVARLAAAYAAGSDLDVVVIALRPRDGGAELAGLLAPAGIAVEVAESAAEAKARIAEMAGRALVLVDTPAVSPGDEEGVKAFAADLRRLKGAEVHLCIPATLSAAAARRVVAAFAPLKPAGIALTHVDETPQVGAVVELAINGGPALTFIGRDTGLEGGLELADPASVAALVLP